MLKQRDLAGGGTNQAWRIEIITPDGAALHPRATLVELATMDGQIGVTPGQEQLVAVLAVGGLVRSHPTDWTHPGILPAVLC